MALTVGNVGGETAAERLQDLLNIKEEERRKQKAEEQDGEGAIKVGKYTDTIMVKEQLEHTQEQFMFDTLDDHYEERIRPDVNESDFTVGRYHFNLRPQGKYVTNPSTWTLETWISIHRKEVDSRTKTVGWIFVNHPRTAKDGQKFVKLSLLANKYMISSIQVPFSDQKELNATTFLYRLRVKLMYMLNYQWAEKQDKKYIHKTYNRSGLLHNMAGSLLGKSRTVENEKLNVSVDHSEVEWDSARSAMDLADEATNTSTGGKMPFPLRTQPLPGAALVMHPFVRVKYNLDKLGHF